MSRPVRVAVVNDYEIVVAGIAAVLAAFPEHVRVVEVDAGKPVVSDVDVVLYDSFAQVQGRDMDVDDLLAHVSGNPSGRVVVFSWNTDAELVRAAFEAGASGYVSKSVTGAELVAAIEQVHAGQRVAPSPWTPESGEEDTFGRWPGAEVGLSPREAEVLALICQGLSNQEVTERAYIGINTVKTYIRSLYAKIGVESRTQAVLWGVDHGFRPDQVRRLQ